MSLTLNQIWPSFCRNIQSPLNSDYDRKINAINLATRYFLSRAIEILPEEHLPGDLLVPPTNLSNLASVNYVVLPTNFFKLMKVWRLQGTLYYPLDGRSLIPYDQLLVLTSNNFFDTTNTGDILYAAVKEPNLYFDKHFSAVGTANIKISYFKVPTEITGYDTLAFTSDTGLAVGDTITGGTSNASAIVLSITSDAGTGTLNYGLSNWNNVAFTATETITGSVTSATATAGATTTKPETFDFMDKYKNILVEISGLQWHVLKGTDEIDGRSVTVDNMIKNLGSINMNKTQINWGYLGNVR